MFGIKFNKSEWNKDWDKLKGQLKETGLLVKEKAKKELSNGIDKATVALNETKQKLNQ